MKTYMTTINPFLYSTGLAAIVLVLLAGAGNLILANDYYLEIDYMVLRDLNGNVLHSHKPQPDEIQAIVQMFACAGNTLHVLVDDEIPEIPVLARDPGNANNFFGYTGANSFGALKNTYCDYPLVFHYCIFAHRYQDENYRTTGSSGLSEICGNDFIVSLGGWPPDGVGTPFQRAATLAHEFGHNLCLRHCGQAECSAVGDFSPNSASTMSYSYQLDGIRAMLVCQGLVPDYLAGNFRQIDYSRGHTCTLDENQLSEVFGMGLGTRVDWNCDGGYSTATQSQDVNAFDDTLHFWCNAGGNKTVLSVRNEWADIADQVPLYPPEELDNLEVSPGITLEEYNRLQAQVGCAPAELTIEPCNGEHYIKWVVPDTTWFGQGHCSDPHKGLFEAYDNSYDYSTLFLFGGNYVLKSSAQFVTFNRPMTLTSTGGFAQISVSYTPAAGGLAKDTVVADSTMQTRTASRPRDHKAEAER